MSQNRSGPSTLIILGSLWALFRAGSSILSIYGQRVLYLQFQPALNSEFVPFFAWALSDGALSIIPQIVHAFLFIVLAIVMLFGVRSIPSQYLAASLLTYLWQFGSAVRAGFSEGVILSFAALLLATWFFRHSKVAAFYGATGPQPDFLSRKLWFLPIDLMVVLALLMSVIIVNAISLVRILAVF